MSTTASPLSVEHLVRRYPRERLFVPPTEWTARHAELLQSAFEVDDSDPAKAAGASDVVAGAALDDPRPYGYWAHEAEVLAYSETKNAVIRRMLMDRNGPYKCIRPFGFFHYGYHHRFRLHGLVFAPVRRRFPLKDQAPVFAFLQRNMIRMQRETLYPMPRNRRRADLRPNVPVATMRQLQIRSLEPKDATRDPYILAVLIGLAQQQADMDPHVLSHSSREYKVCALLVDETNSEYMTFYSANISAAYLQKFDYPESLEDIPTPVRDATLPIRMSEFPYQPYSTLRQRLIDAIARHHGTTTG